MVRKKKFPKGKPMLGVGALNDLAPKNNNFVIGIRSLIDANPEVKIVTNGVETALCSLNHGINMIMIGGRVKDDTHAAIGQTALTQIKAMNFSASFVGANGIEKNGNLTTPDPEEAAVKMAEMKQAQKVFVLADASKIGKRSFAVFANAKDVTVVTNLLKSSQKKALPAKINLEEAK